MVSQVVKKGIKNDIKKMLAKKHGYYRAPAEFDEYKREIAFFIDKTWSTEYKKIQKKYKDLSRQIRSRM